MHASGQGGSPQLIVVTGHPGSGKTTLAKPLMHELRLPLLSKDTIKEVRCCAALPDPSWWNACVRI